MLEIPHPGATLAHVEGRGGPCPWAPSRLAREAVEGDLPPPALSKERALCPEQDVPSDVPDAFFIAG